jgi:hypothetical protein
MFKARLRDPRTWTVVGCIAIVWITMKMGPTVGLRGGDLKDVLGAQSAIGMLISWILKAPKDADAHTKAKADPDAASDADVADE